MNSEKLDVLSTRLQEAALDPTLWPDTLDALSNAVGAAGAVLFSTHQRLAVLCSPSQEAAVDGYHAGGWASRDERYRGVPTMLRDGIVTEEDFIDADSIKRSAYYRDFLERYNLRWFAGLGFNLGGEFWCVSLQRRIDQGPFDTEGLSRLKRLLVPIHDAATLSQKLASARLTGMLEALEVVAQPGLVVDANARVVAMNGSAEKLFSRSIDRASQRLRFQDPQSQARFDTLLKGAIAGAARLPHEATTTVRDARGFWRPVRAVTLRDWVEPFLREARVLLLLPPDAPRVPNASLLQSSLNLTTAEAALAHELALGHSIKAAAGKLGITYETARSCLKIIFSKTGIHRQAELVALVTRLNS